MRISTMDWLGQSQYTKQTVYWASLSTAISEVSSRFITLLSTTLTVSKQVEMDLRSSGDLSPCSSRWEVRMIQDSKNSVKFYELLCFAHFKTACYEVPSSEKFYGPIDGRLNTWEK